MGDRLASWNVNGLRAVLKKDFLEIFDAFAADVFALQETKLQAGQVDLELPRYYQFWSYAQKKGYSGTAVFCKELPRQVLHGLGSDYLDTEGRIVACEFENYWFVDVYTPNSQMDLVRIDHRMEWDDAFREFCQGLELGVLPAGVGVERQGDEGYGQGHAPADLARTEPGETTSPKPVVMCGDFNVAHLDIDLKNPDRNRGASGFSDQERGKFDALEQAGFVDTFRLLHPTEEGRYSWWNYKFKARQTNAGWRIDYFLVSESLASSVIAATIYDDVYGSDHCPIGLELAFD